MEQVKGCDNFAAPNKFFTATTELVSPVKEDTLCDVINTLLSVLGTHNIEASTKRIAEIKLIDMLNNIKA